MGFRITLDGDEKLKAMLTVELEARALQAAKAALKEEGERIMTLSKEAYTPVDTGTLKSSGRVGMPKASGTVASVEMGYGGAAAGYAVHVHEGTTRMAARKYLETPLMGAASTLKNRLQAAFRKAFGRL